jgi:hypothetical protein
LVGQKQALRHSSATAVKPAWTEAISDSWEECLGKRGGAFRATLFGLKWGLWQRKSPVSDLVSLLSRKPCGSIRRGAFTAEQYNLSGSYKIGGQVRKSAVLCGKRKNHFSSQVHSTGLCHLSALFTTVADNSQRHTEQITWIDRSPLVAIPRRRSLFSPAGDADPKICIVPFSELSQPGIAPANHKSAAAITSLTVVVCPAQCQDNPRISATLAGRAFLRVSCVTFSPWQLGVWQRSHSHLQSCTRLR